MKFSNISLNLTRQLTLPIYREVIEITDTNEPFYQKKRFLVYISKKIINMQHDARIEWKGNMHFEAHSNGGTISLDGNPDFGGQDKGLRPKPLILDSLGGCMGMDISSLSKKMRADINLDTFTIDVTGSLTNEHPKYYDKIEIEVSFFGRELKEEKLTKVVNMSIDKYCGVYAMLKTFAEITTNIHFYEERTIK